MSLRPAIGLEVHAQLDTASKLFCRCKNSPLDRPNSNTCPICLGLPGSLPSFNGKVLELAASVGLALNCRVNQISQFARKNYLYPDLPKGYQITQFEKPICEDGYVELKGARVRVRRVHIEEDSGKIVHSKDGSLIDFNRAGVPLVEVVTEPDINSASDAIEYLKSLRLALIYLGVCSGDMESGHFRCEANVSVGYKERSFGVPVELKNINSFKVVKKAIEYEIERQCKTIETGGTVLLETRGWDDSKGQTFRMRSKESSRDYRYFPEPDLPPLKVNVELLKRLKGELSELPSEKRERYQKEYGLSEYDSTVIVKDIKASKFFEDSISIYSKNPKKLANILTGEIFESLKDIGGFDKNKLAPKALAKIVELVDNGVVSSKIVKIIVKDTLLTGEGPEEYISRKGLGIIRDEKKIGAVLDKVLSENTVEVDAYRAGKNGLFKFFVGQIMKETGGQADPEVINKLLLTKLKAKGE